MKQTAEEFLKEKANYLHDPKAVHHFTGDFVIKMMEEFAAEQQTQEGELKKFLYDKFFYLCKRTKFKEDREFANVNAEGYADEVIEYLQSTPPDNSKEKVSEEDIEDVLTNEEWGFGFVPGGAVRIEYVKKVAKAILTKLKQ